MEWDPVQYAAFADERARPGRDLIARIPPIRAGRIYDLGCGRGDLAATLAARWPDADVTGIDNSAAMLADARDRFDGLTWVEADVRTWSAEAPADLIYSNACLHWLPDHAGLFRRLMDQLAPGGVLAVQMPRNFAEPSHALLRALSGAARWRDRVTMLQDPVAPGPEYWRWLRPQARQIDIWETQYLHVLSGEDPVLNWVRGSALRPVLDTLTPAEVPEFEADYAEALRSAYPAEQSGQTLMPFRRLFIVAVKDGS